MSSPINPIVSGIMDAFSMANLIHGQRTQDEQLALSKAREQREAQYQQGQQQRQDADLAMRLNALGARPMTPSDELEANSGMRVNYAPQTTTTSVNDGTGTDLSSLPQQSTRMIPTLEPSDIKGRLVKAGGQQYVLPSQTERESMANRESEREISAKVKETQALADTKTQAEIAGTKAKLQAFGIPVTKENADLLGIQPGTFIMPEHMDDYMRAIATAKGKGDVVHAIPMYGEKGTGVAVVKRDGSVAWNPVDIGEKYSKPARTQETPSETRLREQNALKASVQEAASKYAAAYKDPEEAVARLREDMGKSDNQYAPFLQKNFLAIAKQIRTGGGKVDPNSPDAIADTLRKAIGANKPGGKSAQNGAGGPPPAAKKGKANGDQVRAFAKKNGISFQAAVAQAKKEGYDVTGLETGAGR